MMVGLVPLLVFADVVLVLNKLVLGGDGASQLCGLVVIGRIVVICRSISEVRRGIIWLARTMDRRKPVHRLFVEMGIGSSRRERELGGMEG